MTLFVFQLCASVRIFHAGWKCVDGVVCCLWWWSGFVIASSFVGWLVLVGGRWWFWFWVRVLVWVGPLVVLSSRDPLGWNGWPRAGSVQALHVWSLETAVEHMLGTKKSVFRCYGIVLICVMVVVVRFRDCLMCLLWVSWLRMRFEYFHWG